MPKFLVRHDERVSYEAVIVEAPDAEAAEEIVRSSDPRDFDPSCEDGDDYCVDATEADDYDLKEYREAEVKDGAVVPFKPHAPLDPSCRVCGLTRTRGTREAARDFVLSDICVGCASKKQ